MIKPKFEWHLEKRNLQELVAYEKNARVLGERMHMLLSNSLSKFGMAEKPVVNSDNIIIGGHQRIQILIEQGATYCECWFPDSKLSEKEAEEFNILLNKLSGDWDHDILGNMYDISDLLTYGFDEDDLGLGKAEKPEKKVKAVISFEFADKETMLAYLSKCEEIASESSAKMKVRG
jgi:hypothetical protein